MILEITLRKSPIGRPPGHRLTLKTLGLTRLQKTVRHRETPALMGMVNQVRHLVEVKRVADGRIYTAQQAKDLGLVDSLGYLDDAVELAKKQAGLEEAAKVVRYHRPGTGSTDQYHCLTPTRASSGPASVPRH